VRGRGRGGGSCRARLDEARHRPLPHLRAGPEALEFGLDDAVEDALLRTAAVIRLLVVAPLRAMAAVDRGTRRARESPARGSRSSPCPGAGAGSGLAVAPREPRPPRGPGRGDPEDPESQAPGLRGRSPERVALRDARPHVDEVVVAGVTQGRARRMAEAAPAPCASARNAGPGRARGARRRARGRAMFVSAVTPRFGLRR
jgi:hypothetical protein